MVTIEQVIWAFRLLLEREPESYKVIVEKMKCHSLDSLIQEFLKSEEFQEKHPCIGVTIDRWVMIKHDLGFRIWVNLADQIISGLIIKNEFEKSEISFVQKHIKTGNSVIDNGTDIGFFSMLFSKLVGKKGNVLGFEPLKFLFDAAC